jgi:two-component system sensor histidine kinase PilS (NtrC family)
MGYAKAEVRSRFWWDVFAWPDYARDRLPVATLPGGIEEISARKDGQRLLLGMNLSTLYDEQGIPIGMVGVFQDISLQKKVEEENRRRQWLAKIGEMSAGMAHEIRNPLAALSGSMQVLRKELQPSDDNRLLMDLALRETERLSGIVSDFLQYARPRPLFLKECDVNELVNDTVCMLERTPEYGGRITFVRHLAPGSVLGLLDSDQMQQVCLNIALNACQAMPAGGTLTVSTHRAAEGGNRVDNESVEIVFEDTGQGIPRDHRDKIFDPFFTTKEAGTGLGLSVVHRIMEDHRGRVQVDSEPGAGTRVRLTLPAAGVTVT